MLPSTAELYGRSGVGLGESPFGIKGFGYTQHHEWVEANLPGGLAAQWAAMGPRADHPFFKQTFYAGTFYDIFPLILLGHACASVAGVTCRDFVRARARSQAEQDLRYIRKWLVKLASPVQVARRLPSVATAYFNFGATEAEPRGDGLDGVITGIPQTVSQWLIPVIEGFATHTLEVNGAQQITVHSRAVLTDKTQAGFPLERIITRFRWRAQGDDG